MAAIGRLLLVLALILNGCSAHDPSLRLSPDIPPEKQEQILAALDRWHQAIPDVTLEARVEVPSNVVIRELEPGVHGTAGRHYIKIAPYVEGAWLLHVATHEIGHYLGYLEHLEEPNLMAPRGGPCITQADIDAVCKAIGGCEGETFPEC